MNITKFETNLSKFKYLHNEGTKNIDKNIKNIENDLIIIYPEVTYQEIIGFGGAFTEAAGYCFSKLPQDRQNQFIDDYFSKEGNNYTLCRTHIGSCDFCLDTYSYSNNESLSDFNIDRDKKFIIPMMKKAFEKNKDIQMVASPWSPPAFMKSNKKLKHGGKLIDKYKSLWAEYLVKYLKSYQQEGIDINYMTIQNEPKAAQFWESCQYTSKEEQELIKNHISPTFKKNDINTKLLIWDHNKERVVYRAKEIFDDKDVKDMVAGIGYHYYSGDYFENIKTFKELYPDKLAIHTEGCTGYERLWFRKKRRRVPNAEIYAHDIIGDLNNGTNAYIDWNILLDFKGGPNHVLNYCNSPIMANIFGNKYKKNACYYYIGHFSKYIEKGAKVIENSVFTDRLEVLSAKNPDGKIVVIVMNKSNKKDYFELVKDGKVICNKIAPHSIITFII